MIAVKIEQLPDARLDVKKLRAVHLVQFVHFGCGGEPVPEILLLDQGQFAVHGVVSGVGLYRTHLLHRIQHLLHKAGLDARRALAEFERSAHQSAVFGNAGGLRLNWGQTQSPPQNPCVNPVRLLLLPDG